jgi:hypothetical protein
MDVVSMTETLQLGDTQVDGPSLAEVCRRYGVRGTVSVGSAVRGEMRPESDIDIWWSSSRECTHHRAGQKAAAHASVLPAYGEDHTHERHLDWLWNFVKSVPDNQVPLETRGSLRLWP